MAKTVLKKRLSKLVKNVKKGSAMKGPPPAQPIIAEATLKATEKAANAALKIKDRCFAVHGKVVRDVLGAQLNQDCRYTRADLAYDLKHGRLVQLKSGKAGALPAGKGRAAAPLAGKPLPRADLDEFFRFLQCQLSFETHHLTGHTVKLADKAAAGMFADVEKYITPGLGATERWVPYHTILGVHEIFLVQNIHNRKDWSAKQKFLAMFIFRSHCKTEVFLKAQEPHMKGNFWKDPKKAFQPGGVMEKSMLAYRKKTGKAMITNCFRIIPERILKDDDENLVRSITKRTLELIDVAEFAYPVIQDSKKSARQKFDAISARVQTGQGLGETWAKMLMVCIDLAYPKERLLTSVCDVGTGALPPLKVLLPKEKFDDSKQVLVKLQKMMNGSKSIAAGHFWKVLKESETHLRKEFKTFPLIVSQATTKVQGLTAATVQVQLCEYRQFRHSLARLKYGLAEDDSMRGDPENSNVMLNASEQVYIVKGQKKARFDWQAGGGKTTPFEVNIKGAITEQVAKSAATICFRQLRTGMSWEETLKYRNELVGNYKGGEDAPASSPAWSEVVATPTHRNPLVSFSTSVRGKTVQFQTTAGAAGGNLLEAERIARLCWVKLHSGVSKDKVLEFRQKQYQRLRASSQAEPPAKRQRV
eukprot:TRINITY_DN7905_c0_g2_i1.p1 TRINITY_DN7905_c0_g2~~TRINITY_DN7905_c0_g2_i1.p1  ORF type:complete len:645 (-),score=189.17 TRINITY_DN7905_c0_g2_i1:74-2008(-)